MCAFHHTSAGSTGNSSPGHYTMLGEYWANWVILWVACWAGPPPSLAGTATVSPGVLRVPLGCSVAAYC